MSGYIGTQPVPQATQTRDSFTATSGQVSFSCSGYTPNFLDVFLNGVKLAAADYTATNGSDVVLASGAATGDILEVVAFTTFTPASIPAGTPSIDDNGNATAITIDSSENVLVGKTSAGYNVDGFEAHPNGETYVSRSGTPMAINRNSSDGTLLNFYKDGTGVGSIGSRGTGTSYITLKSTSGAGAGLTGSDNRILPMDESALADNNTDLGMSTYRWKDLYLSGGVYLGGTGSANQLDDYEEGTWTPVGVNFNINSVSHATYVKIGKQVTIQGWITNANGTGGANVAQLTGLPFSSVTYSVGNANCANTNSNIPRLHNRTVSGQAKLDFIKNNDEGVSGADIDAGYLIFTVTYTAS